MLKQKPARRNKRKACVCEDHRAVALLHYYSLCSSDYKIEQCSHWPWYLINSLLLGMFWHNTRLSFKDKRCKKSLPGMTDAIMEIITLIKNGTTLFNWINTGDPAMICSPYYHVYNIHDIIKLIFHCSNYFKRSFMLCFSTIVQWWVQVIEKMTAIMFFCVKTNMTAIIFEANLNHI